ncbi:MAG: asparagine synthase (glutamine-hydrolyzing) [Thiobacillus sp.]
MCGISGIFAYHDLAPPVDEGELLRVRDRMVARGPDAAGLWISDDRRVGLAHRRLAIIDLSPGGVQPMHDPETGNWIVFNGEIYNHHALRTQLNRAGVVTRSQSDTEVLLKLYALHGSAMLTMLRGMFAFAIWDAQKRHLFLARDAYGIKPLYIADDGRTLRFASQVKALLAGQVDTRPEPAGHVGFLLWGSVPEPFTLYKGIRSMPPGHWLTVAHGRTSEPVCFDSPALRLAQIPSVGAEGEQAALHQIAGAVRDSVAAHMVADVPVGVFLSAGLDSTMLAACAAKLGNLRTLTLGFSEYANSVQDEAALAGTVADSLNASHTLHRISAVDFANDREHLLAAMDQPSIDGINTWFVAKAAAQQGLKVALSGIGGDELFGSYPSFTQLPRLLKALRGFTGSPLIGRAVRKGLSVVSGVLPSPKYAGILEYGGTLGGAYLLRRGLFMPWEIAALLGRDMAAQGLMDLNTLEALAACKQGIGSERLAISALETQWYMKNQLLRDADWAGMAHSLEIRVPFVDMTLLENFVQITSLKPIQEKAMIARSVAPALPEAILNRPKTGFAVPIYQWLNPDAPSNISNHRVWAQMLYRNFTQPA